MLPHGPATLADVAARAGVSLATASRALNGSVNRQVRKELQERVHRAARELDYSPNAQAQAMARGRTATLGLVVHDIADPYFSAIASGVIEAAAAHGLLVTIPTPSSATSSCCTRNARRSSCSPARGWTIPRCSTRCAPPSGPSPGAAAGSPASGRTSWG
jgi:DNA-binding LacI/PurR family transcriptional regulator